MSMRRGWIAAVALFAFGVTARADYSYTTAITINTETFGTPNSGLSSVTIMGNNGGPLTSSNSIATATIDLASTNTGTPDSVTVTYTEAVTITNPTPGGVMQTFNIDGTLTVTNFTSTSAISHNVYTSYSPTSAVMVGGSSFLISVPLNVQDANFSPPTVNGGVFTSGGLGANVATSVPEPASMALIGIGLTGMVGYGWRRREVTRRGNLA